ncbi:glutaredoxin [Hydrogenivirga caldilitoris]|uniref:Glutaredoxin n=1 Tax=Hydrogenivirga caldilitoris TaxID=246264 RepID=A0A497XNV4_9AQUI|nr:glutaredoxin family protein [Hydrogenivirga caldilitoris]RLJ69799.1 glutaredoxin [Hydrogenivirga caldilitoris]
MKFVLVTQEVCPRCDRVKKLLSELQREVPFEWEEVDMYEMLDTFTYLGIATTPVLLVEDEDEDYTEEHIVFMGELPRKWRLKEIIESHLGGYGEPQKKAV